MSTASVRAHSDLLSVEEWEIVCSLRQIPAGPARDGLAGLVADLVAYVVHPHCAESQADGTPCLSVHLSCEECRQVVSVLDSLRRRVQRA
jgi:hypothetical protein